MILIYEFFILPIIYIILDYFSEAFCLHCSKLSIYRKQIVSFTAGITLAYLFLQLFPETFLEFSWKLLPYGLVMVSLTMFYFLHQRVHNYAHKELHILIRTIYHILVGTIFYHISHHNLLHAAMLAAPIFISSIFSSLTTHQTEHIKGEKSYIPILSKISLLSPLFGTLIAMFLGMQADAVLLVFAFVTGAMLYIVINEYLSEKEDISVFFIIIGQVLFLLMLMFLG